MVSYALRDEGPEYTLDENLHLHLGTRLKRTLVARLDYSTTSYCRVAMQILSQDTSPTVKTPAVSDYQISRIAAENRLPRLSIIDATARPGR